MERTKYAMIDSDGNEVFRGTGSEYHEKFGIDKNAPSVALCIGSLLNGCTIRVCEERIRMFRLYLKKKPEIEVRGDIYRISSLLDSRPTTIEQAAKRKKSWHGWMIEKTFEWIEVKEN